MEIEVRKISEACCHILLHLLTGASHQVKSFLPEELSWLISVIPVINTLKKEDFCILPPDLGTIELLFKGEKNYCRQGHKHHIFTFKQRWVQDKLCTLEFLCIEGRWKWTLICTAGSLYHSCCAAFGVLLRECLSSVPSIAGNKPRENIKSFSTTASLPCSALRLI